MRLLLAAVGTASLAFHGWAAEPVTAPAPEALIDQLSADIYADREAASKALLKVGSTALAALDRAALNAVSPEARDRAARIAEQIRRSSEGSKLLAVTPISLDYVGVPLGKAVSDLKAKTGIPLALDPTGVKDPLRTVTIKTGSVSPWQAVEEFCRVAGLRELHRIESQVAASPNPYMNQRRIAYSTNGMTTELPGSVTLLLVDGKPDDLPGDRATAVRIVALPPSFSANRVIRGSGELVLNLDVTPLPSLRWQEVTSVRVSRVEDETGRPLSVSFRPEDPRGVPGNGYNEVWMQGGMMVQQQMWIEDDYGGVRPAVRMNPRIVPIKLRTDDRAITRLKVLEGTVVGEVHLPNQTQFSVDNLSKSTEGTTYHGPNESHLSVTGYSVATNGVTTLRIRTESQNGWQAQRLGGWRARGGMNVGQTDATGLSVGFGALKFYDAAGKQLRQPQIRQSSSTDDGFRLTSEMELHFPKQTDSGPPVKMVSVGNKPIAVEVPFRMEHVRLP